MKLHLVVEAEHPNEAPRWHTKPALMEASEADDVALWRVWLQVGPWRDTNWLLSLNVCRQEPVADEPLQVMDRTSRRLPWCGLPYLKHGSGGGAAGGGEYGTKTGGFCESSFLVEEERCGGCRGNCATMRWGSATGAKANRKDELQRSTPNTVFIYINGGRIDRGCCVMAVVNVVGTAGIDGGVPLREVRLAQGEITVSQ